jgi:uncharacterized protein
LLSEAIFKEYYEVLRRKSLGLSVDKINSALKFIIELALMVFPTEKFNLSPDPDDNKFLECAAAGKANFLVTGNKKHFPLPEFQGTKIIYPSEFLAILQQ